MNIDSPRYGSLDVEPSRIIEFPRGLAGFEDCRRFTLFHPEPESAQTDAAPRYFILQSLDDPGVAFHIADPALFDFTYEITLSDEDTAMLQITDPAQTAVVVILTKESAGQPLRANLNAPLVINLESRRGLQHMFARLDYQLAAE
jgi:flagellar assembly factor FliW